MGLWVWFDVRNTQEPQALVMLEDVTIGRTKIPGSDWSEPKASAVDEVFADGTLDVRREDGHMVGFELSYGGITDEDDEDDD